MGLRVHRVPVAQLIQAHRLLDMVKAVQVREWEAVDLPLGSTVITEEVVVEETAPHRELANAPSRIAGRRFSATASCSAHTCSVVAT